MTRIFKDKSLRDIFEKIQSGVPASEEDLLAMLSTDDIVALGSMAHHVKQSLHKNNVYYGVNLTLNYTNICELRCPLCAFSRNPGDADAYTMSIDQVAEKVSRAVQSGIDEVHIVGGLHPLLKLDYYISIIKAVKSIDPLLHVVAFTAVEYDHFARVNNLPIEDVIIALKNAGVDAIPGGGAEIFAPRVRNIIAPKKISAERWLFIHESAHREGLRSNATLLYNHFECKEDVVGHLSMLRKLQEKTNGFKALVPLVFHEGNTGLRPNRGIPTGFDTIRLFAASRIFLHNFSHIKAHWMYLGEQCAEMLLSFGVDDIGATYIDEKIVHSAGAASVSSGSEGVLCRLIQRAGGHPIRVNSSYQSYLGGKRRQNPDFCAK